MWLSPTSVGTELKSIRLEIDPDPRLAAAAGGAAHYLGCEAGLEHPGLSQLQTAVVAACQEEIRHFVPGVPGRLEVKLTRFADRIEILLCHRGNHTETPGTRAGVDRVQFENRGDCVVTRLTKYIRDNIPRA